MVKVRTTTACPGCGSADFGVFALGHTSLNRCLRCHLVFAPEYAAPDDVYVDGYLSGRTDFGLDLSSPLFQEFLAYAASIRLAVLEEACGGPGSLLDVGCGTGEVLAVARQRGWAVQGVEPVQESATHAVEQRRVPVVAATLEASGLPECHYDVVTAFHVVEHMVDAAAFLATIARWVRPGGYVAVEVPNWHSLHRRNAGERWNHLRPLEHVGHYGPRTLRAAMTRADIDPIMVRTMGFLWEKQTLQEQLNDLGLYRWGRWLRPLGVRGRRGDEEAVFPGWLAARGLRGIQAALGRAGTGQVVLGIGRPVPVPSPRSTGSWST